RQPQRWIGEINAIKILRRDASQYAIGAGTYRRGPGVGSAQYAHLADDAARTQFHPCLGYPEQTRVNQIETVGGIAFADDDFALARDRPCRERRERGKNGVVADHFLRAPAHQQYLGQAPSVQWQENYVKQQDRVKI